MTKTEKHIETYIFHPEELTPGQKSEIEKYIEENEEIRILAGWYRELREQIDAVEQTKKRVRPGSSAIELTASAREKRKKYVFRLAAKTPAKYTKQLSLKTLRTFISEREGTIVRVLNSEGDSAIHIHAISEKIAADDMVLLMVPGLKELLISKPGGIFELKASTIVPDVIQSWDSCTLFVPVDRLDILVDEQNGNVFLDSHQTNKDELNIAFEEKAESYELRLTTSGGYSIQKVVASCDGKGFLLEIEREVVEIPKSIIKGRLTSIFFYN